MTVYQEITGSGFMNNPIRTVIIDRDNRYGSYPVETPPGPGSLGQEFITSKPFRDTITIETPSARATARISITGRPESSESVYLVNANSITHEFVFRDTLPTFSLGPNVYPVDLSGVIATATSPLYPGLTPRQITIKNCAARLITAINAATGSLMSARPGDNIGEILLEQRIPGSAGNQNNSSTTADVTVEDFSNGSAAQVRYPYGIPVRDGNGYPTSELLQRVLRSPKSGTMDVPTSGRASLLDAPSDGHPWCNCTPFDETNSQQSFGVGTGGSRQYGVQAGLDSEFFTRGSVSGSLDEPLRAKDKIVIDLTPIESTTIKSKNTIDDNYHMMYFNHATKKWEKLGFGEYYLKNSPTLQQYLDRGYIGFGQFYNNVAYLLSDTTTYTTDFIDPEVQSEYQKIVQDGLTTKRRIFSESIFGAAIDTYGFPLHPKFHATASQAFKVSEIIDRPFLIEKIVYEFSGSAEKGSLPGASFVTDSGTNMGWRSPTGVFFILNQRKANPDPGQENSYTNAYVSNRAGGFTAGNTYRPPIRDGQPYTSPPNSFVFNYSNGGIPQNRVLSQGANPTYVDTIRDLVTFARIGCVWPTYNEEIANIIVPGTGHPAKVLDLAIDVPASGTFNGNFTLAANIKAPVSIPAASFTILNSGSTVGPNIGSTNIISIYSSRDSSTRNAIDVSTGRSRTAEFAAAPISSITRYSGGANVSFYNLKNDVIDSPYLIKPGDELIFGWQAPVSNRTAMDTGARFEGYPLTIGTGKGKLILYGSYLRDDKPVHDIFKSPLGSDALHEALPAGPWVLDRFESDPQMMYSSSMREEYVTGTMLTKNANGGLVVTSENDFSIGGVRAVSARVSSGNVRQRWSFFRNNRLFDSSEQYYDSMQPNPIKVLFDVSNTRGNLPRMYRYTFASDVRYYIPLLLPGDTDTAESDHENYGNDTLIGSYPFESAYTGIERVKKIDSKIIQANQRISFLLAGLPSSARLDILETVLFAGDQKDLAQSFSKYGLVGSSEGYLLQISRDDTNIPRGIGLTDAPNLQDSALSGTFASGQTIDGINYHASRFMGCFGEGIYGAMQVGTQGGSEEFIVAKMLYRGVKHGLINPTPLYSSAVFNGTQFGQLRDMMEQRQYTRFSLNDNTLTDSAVEVTFINRSAPADTLNVTSGSATNSSNISKFATSEHPYDDARASAGLIWDRATPLPEDSIAL